MPNYFNDLKDADLFRLPWFRSAAGLLRVWPDTKEVLLPNPRLAAAFAMHPIARFSAGNEAGFRIQPWARDTFGHSLFVVGFRLMETGHRHRWSFTIPVNDWYGGPRYQVPNRKECDR